MTTTTPQAQAQLAETAELPAGTDERFAGCALLGMPFSSGHYLAYRWFPASSVGPGYSAVWVLRPNDGWTIYADAPPAVSCFRYFGATPAQTRFTEVSATWTAPFKLTITVPAVVHWELSLGATLATSAMSAIARTLPARWWHSQAVLVAMGRMAGPALNAGRMSLTGLVPNGQSFQAKPLRLWAVTSSVALIDGVNAGTPKPLARQLRLADFWLPQRGLFATDLVVRFPSTSHAKAREPEHHGHH